MKTKSQTKIQIPKQKYFMHLSEKDGGVVGIGEIESITKTHFIARYESISGEMITRTKYSNSLLPRWSDDFAVKRQFYLYEDRSHVVDDLFGPGGPYELSSECKCLHCYKPLKLKPD